MNNSVENFKTWALGYSGCDGGDIGTPNNSSIWFCGIEWGGGWNEDDFLINLRNDVKLPPSGYDDLKVNFEYVYNRQAMKILGVIHGFGINESADFVDKYRPFVQKSTGFFKLNLYPLAFKNTSHSLWRGPIAQTTGFPEKNQYIAWIRSHRFPQMRIWAKEHKPKLILCTGKTYAADFMCAFGDGGVFNSEEIEGKTLQWYRNQDGTVVAVIPFMVNRYGLTRNDAIQAFGQRIRQIIQDPLLN